jgi:ABC-type uncharacterized transport system substrate-binding protein
LQPIYRSLRGYAFWFTRRIIGATRFQPMADIRRRKFIAVLGGMTVAWPLLTRAQQPVKKVGFLSVSSPKAHATFVAAFNEGLKEVGFIEGQNLAIEYSWAEGQFDRLPAMAADLIRNKVDVIAAMSGDVSIRAATTASSTVPVVFITGSDLRFRPAWSRALLDREAILPASA